MEESDNEFEGVEMEISPEEMEQMKTKMVTLAVVMSKGGSYKETSVSVQNRSEDCATAVRDKSPVYDVQVAHLQVSNNPNGFTYYEINVKESEIESLWDVSEDPTATIIPLRDTKDTAVKIATTVNRQGEDGSFRTKLEFEAYLVRPENISMLPHLRKVEFKVLSSTSIIVRALLVDTKATSFQCDVDAHRALAGAILKIGTVKGGSTQRSIASGGCLEGVVSAKVISTTLRCGNVNAVREGKVAIFSGIIVTLELDGEDDLDWETVALPTTIGWPSKVTIIPQAGDKPDRIAAKGQKRTVPVWWTGTTLRNSGRFDISLNRDADMTTSMLVVGGTEGATKLDPLAIATAKAKPRRRSGAERRQSATRSTEAGVITEVWQELSDEVHGRQVGPPACRVAAHNLAKTIKDSNNATSADEYRRAANSSLKYKEGRWLTEKATAEAAISCIRDTRGKGGGCGGVNIEWR